MSQECPLGRTDYEACMSPFRYCPQEGCGRIAPPSPAEQRRKREVANACAILTDFANMLETTPYVQNQDEVVSAIRLLVARSDAGLPGGEQG